MPDIAHNLHLRVIQQQPSGQVYLELTHYVRGGERHRSFYSLDGYADAPAVLDEVREILTRNAAGMIWA